MPAGCTAACWAAHSLPVCLQARLLSSAGHSKVPGLCSVGSPLCVPPVSPLPCLYASARHGNGLDHSSIEIALVLHSPNLHCIRLFRAALPRVAWPGLQAELEQLAQQAARDKAARKREEEAKAAANKAASKAKDAAAAGAAGGKGKGATKGGAVIKAL